MAQSLSFIKEISHLSSSCPFFTLSKIQTSFPSKPTLSRSHSYLSVSQNQYSSSTLRCLVSSTLFYRSGDVAYYASLIARSTQKRHLRQVHAQILLSGLRRNGFLAAKLANVSSDLGYISYARKVFHEFTDPDVFLWNAIVRGYSKHDMLGDVVEAYSRMQAKGVGPDRFTFPHVLKACGGLKDLEFGRRVHGQLVRLGYGCDVFMQNSLVAFYAKCGRVERSRTVFDRLNDRSVVSWTSMISGYAQNGQPMEALRIFGQMRRTNVGIDGIVLVSVLRAFADVNDLEQGKAVHGCLVKIGLEFEPDLIVSLSAMYAKGGQVAVARSFFDQMEEPSLILWNAMISGYAKNGCADEAVELFGKMIAKNIKTDSITLRSAVSACAQVGSLELAKSMDDHISKGEYKADIFVSTAVIDMYAKCGNVDLARELFDRTPEKDVFVWSAMIAGYGLHGRGRDAIELYLSMEKSGVLPNDVTFLALLTACNHSGLVEEGWELFHRMKDYGIEPRNQHYSCVVALLGRAGYLEKAYDFIANMEIEPGTSVWGALLNACNIHNHVTMGEHAAEKLFALDPYNTGYYVQLSNIYASARMWDQVEKVRVLAKERGLSKDLGYSVIEIDGKLERFHVGDKSHPRSREIFAEAENLERKLKEAGFLTHKESLIRDLDYEENEETICKNSHRIAVGF